MGMALSKRLANHTLERVPEDWDSLSWGEYDNDGYVDWYVAIWR